jgi:nucleotide-binding universal stress UspA family protein
MMPSALRRRSQGGRPRGCDARWRLAGERDVDLIIVGPCAPGIVERVLRHGVSRSVSRKAHRDVTIVHPG